MREPYFKGLEKKKKPKEKALLSREDIEKTRFMGGDQSNTWLFRGKKKTPQLEPEYCVNCPKGEILNKKCSACGHEYKLRIMKNGTMTKSKPNKFKLIPAIRVKEVTDALK